MKAPLYRVGQEVILNPEKPENMHLHGRKVLITTIPGWRVTEGNPSGCWWYTLEGFENVVQESALKRCQSWNGTSFEKLISSLKAGEVRP